MSQMTNACPECDAGGMYDLAGDTYRCRECGFETTEPVRRQAYQASGSEVALQLEKIEPEAVADD